LKEIGEQLKHARENMGLTIDEVAEDLQLKPSQIENVENGNRAFFKDVFALKQVIKDYAKYLGLEYEKLEDEFNEFVFVYTSKIPLDDIAKANKEKDKEKEQTKEIKSPYTMDIKSSSYVIKILIFIVLT
jgi:cytoskeleton protein RodZ